MKTTKILIGAILFAVSGVAVSARDTSAAPHNLPGDDEAVFDGKPADDNLSRSPWGIPDLEPGDVPDTTSTRETEQMLAEPTPARSFDTPVFWGTRLINLPTTTTIPNRIFLLRISHRFFQSVDVGFDDLFGLDGFANILIGFGYGITDNLSVTVGRARLFKEFEFGADWLIAGQDSAARIPFSLTLHGGLSLATDGDDRIKLNTSLSLSRQFTNRFSIMIVPGFSSNTNHWDVDTIGTLSLGFGARYMIFEDFSVITEWTPVLSGYKDRENGWGLGLEKKIGGHVFQVFVTNTFGMTTPQVLPGGDLRFGDFGFRIGFNIFRMF